MNFAQQKAASELIAAIESALPYAPHRAEFDIVADKLEEFRKVAVPVPIKPVQAQPVVETIVKLLANRIITPDGTVLQSHNRHDFAYHIDSITKEEYFTDGGTDYIRRSVNVVPAKDDDCYSNEPHEVIREKAKWGTYGKSGKEAIRYIAIKDLETEHIHNILMQTSGIVSKIMTDELEFRLNLSNHRS